MPLPPDTEAKLLTARTRAAQRYGRAFGKPVFLRLLKEEALLELHGRREDGSWVLLHCYPIAAQGSPNEPKEREGDGRSPEGFYNVSLAALNPRSKYHLAFNIGYPNCYDRALGRSGSLIMVHGGASSVGCFAVTDAGIEELYGMVEAALLGGQNSVPVQIYPFRMTAERMETEIGSPHRAARQHLLPGWAYTEETSAPYPSADGR